MSTETFKILELIFRALIGLGAISATWFFLDYLRTANLESYFAKMLLTLNGAMAIVLWISLGRFFFTLSIWWNIIMMVMFGVVDLMLIAQIYLLHKVRDANDGDKG